MKKYYLSALLLTLSLSSVSAQVVDTDTSDTISTCTTITTNISYKNRKNNNKADVMNLQDFLNSTGYLNSDSITGFFGRVTESAVAKFQKDNGLVANPAGFVGVGTRAKIKMLSCSGNTGVNTVSANVNVNTNTTGISQLTKNQVLNGFNQCGTQFKNGTISIGYTKYTELERTCESAAADVSLFLDSIIFADLDNDNVNEALVPMRLVRASSGGGLYIFKNVNGVARVIDGVIFGKGNGNIVSVNKNIIVVEVEDFIRGENVPYKETYKFINNKLEKVSGVAIAEESSLNNSNLPEGCKTTSGFSPVTGVKCSTIINSNVNQTISNPASQTSVPLNVPIVTNNINLINDSNSSTTNSNVNPPVITSVSPTSGPLGTLVTINGTNLSSMGNSVYMNNILVDSLSGGSSVKGTFVVPEITPGVYQIKALNISNINGGVSNLVPFTVTKTKPTASITVNGLHTISLVAGTSNKKVWKSTSGDSWSSTYSFSGSCPKSGTSGSWNASSPNGFIDDIASADHIGCTSTITYTVSNDLGSVSDKLYITTIAPPLAKAPQLSLHYKGNPISNSIITSTSVPLAFMVPDLKIYNATSWWLNIDGVEKGPYKDWFSIQDLASFGLDKQGTHYIKTKGCNIGGCSSYVEEGSPMTLTIKDNKNAPYANLYIENSKADMNFAHDVILKAGTPHRKGWVSWGGTSWNSTYSFSGTCSKAGTSGVWDANSERGSVDNIANESNIGCTSTITYNVSNSYGTTTSVVHVTTVPAD